MYACKVSERLSTSLHISRQDLRGVIDSSTGLPPCCPGWSGVCYSWLDCARPGPVPADRHVCLLESCLEPASLVIIVLCLPQVT